MSVTTENAPVQGQTTLQENRAGEGVYASLFEKINLAPASHLGEPDETERAITHLVDAGVKITHV
ncbi:TPA: hypothetical protein L9L15_004094 [Klebsiella pneumoniae]|nr:hypothetical protein [Klebsiella pneumoniae]